jgi:hypothetical protein
MKVGCEALVCSTFLCTLAACAGLAVERWERIDDSRVADVSETSDCRLQARYQAALRYPHQPIDQAFQRPNVDDGDRLRAEISLFEACMQRKGFARQEIPPRARAGGVSGRGATLSGG